MTSQPSLFPDQPVKTDICENFHGGNKLSELANDQIQPHKDSIKDKIVRFVKSRFEGATCEEIEIALALRHQTASARLTELKKENRVLMSSVRRTSTGSFAAVYFVPEENNEEIR